MTSADAGRGRGADELLPPPCSGECREARLAAWAEGEVGEGETGVVRVDVAVFGDANPADGGAASPAGVADGALALPGPVRGVSGEGIMSASPSTGVGMVMVVRTGGALLASSAASSGASALLLPCRGSVDALLRVKPMSSPRSTESFPMLIMNWGG